ncbi:MAG: Na+/H+ antiporter NhaA [Tannerellaceae bacterium]|jgi:NhaA family Na+:H+ antiporter|nr:Na+/H+ antiporter NhaA [Tannerellaceae bacterium]
MKQQEDNGKTYLIDKYVQPVHRFIKQDKASGIVLGGAVLIALIWANSPLSHSYFNIFQHKLGFRFDGQSHLEFSIYHWINDGLMAIFFFVVGLELKREFVEGELSNVRTAILPIAAAVGGMLVPAVIYYLLNRTGEAANGWGIPMATDIAFALGVLYLFGKRVPTSIKIFLAALAIVDDLGAVVVIAFFYTSNIYIGNLLIGFAFVAVMFAGNMIGIRNLFFYAILGVAGVWVAFVTSGVHATIAAVIAAFTIPADVRINPRVYINRMEKLLKDLNLIQLNARNTLSEEQVHLFGEIKQGTNDAIPPLQRLEHAFYPVAMFGVLPVFAVANAGVPFQVHADFWTGSVSLGVALGLFVGKPLGVIGTTWLLVKLKIAKYPKGMNFLHLMGVGLLASIGFTMSIFITSLAFTEPAHFLQAKLGIFAASIAGGGLGYLVLKKAIGKEPSEVAAKAKV